MVFHVKYNSCQGRRTISGKVPEDGRLFLIFAAFNTSAVSRGIKADCVTYKSHKGI